LIFYDHTKESFGLDSDYQFDNRKYYTKETLDTIFQQVTKRKSIILSGTPGCGTSHILHGSMFALMNYRVDHLFVFMFFFFCRFQTRRVLQIAKGFVAVDKKCFCQRESRVGDGSSIIFVGLDCGF